MTTHNELFADAMKENANRIKAAAARRRQSSGCVRSFSESKVNPSTYSAEFKTLCYSSVKCGFRTCYSSAYSSEIICINQQNTILHV